MLGISLILDEFERFWNLELKEFALLGKWISGNVS